MSPKDEIILIGGGGHCKACIDVIEQEGRFAIKGIVDIPEKIGQTILGYPIIDSDKNLKTIVSNYKNFLITVGFIKTSDLRIKLFNLINSFGGNFPSIVSPKAYVSKHAVIGKGTIIMHGVIISAAAKIGNNCIINNLALVEHDTLIDANTHVSTGARINGNCEVGNKCFVGSGTIINNGVNITNDVIIGSGSLIRKDIGVSGTYSGNPIKRSK
jgi:sugar O-acyltransferase (sialic acid O-acetyltransferase NeuD family)